MRSNIKGVELSFETASTVFSPQGIDKGTLAMLSLVAFSQGDKILDLGCGYGVVGIYAAKVIGEENVVMSDISKKCIELSQKNALNNHVGNIKIIQSDGFKDLYDKDFTFILSNPPYHADFSIAKHFIEKGFNRLQVGGTMVMVTKRKDWYKNKLQAIFGGVKVREVDSYFVFLAEKRGIHYANKKQRKT
ncbi:MAG: methyltransferase [Defluviitaleaceae bacterium]|nr:methyltransferase [Defluviitaleaceae bacterium]